MEVKLFACASEQKSPAGAKANTRERDARPVHAASSECCRSLSCLSPTQRFKTGSAHPKNHGEPRDASPKGRHQQLRYHTALGMCVATCQHVAQKSLCRCTAAGVVHSCYHTYVVWKGGYTQTCRAKDAAGQPTKAET